MKFPALLQRYIIRMYETKCLCLSDLDNIYNFFLAFYILFLTQTQFFVNMLFKTIDSVHFDRTIYFIFSNNSELFSVPLSVSCHIQNILIYVNIKFNNYSLI